MTTEQVTIEHFMVGGSEFIVTATRSGYDAWKITATKDGESVRVGPSTRQRTATSTGQIFGTAKQVSKFLAAQHVRDSFAAIGEPL